MAETRVDPNELRRIAQDIEALMDNQKVFQDLAAKDPNAGKFDTAQWLEFVFKDRREGVVQHVKYLELACAEIATGLVQIANAFERVDTANGQAIEAFNKLALDTVNGMDDAEFVPVMSAKPPANNFDSGDNKKTGDTGVVVDGDKVLIKDEPFAVGAGGKPLIPGMDPFLSVDLQGDKPVITLADAPDGQPGGEGKPNHAPTHLSAGGPSDYKPSGGGGGGSGGGGGGGGGGGPVPTGANFNAKAEPDRNVYKATEHRHRGRVYTVYEFEGQAQTNEHGQRVFWFNGKVYYDRNRDGNPDVGR